MNRDRIKYILRENLLIEGLTDIVYHFTSVSNAAGILKSDAIKAAPIFSEDKLSDEEEDFSKGKYYYISTTSTKNPKSGYANTLKTFGEYLSCFNLNGKAINHRYKSVRVDYFSKIKNTDKKVDEMEDRIIMDDPELKPLSKYVNEIHVEYSEDVLIKKYLYVKNRAEELGIPIYFYDDDRYFAAQRKDKAIDLSSITSEEPDEKSAIPSIERRPHISTKLLLALTVHEDDELKERVRKDLSKIENIEEMLKKEGIDSVETLIDQSLEDFESKLYALKDSPKFEDKSLMNVFKKGVIKEIKNVKSVSKDPINRTIMHNFVLSMKKQRTNDIDRYLRNKLDIEKKEAA